MRTERWDDDDCGEDVGGMIRNPADYAAAAAARPDIFDVDTNRHSSHALLAAMVTAAGVGVGLNRFVPEVNPAPDFVDSALARALPTVRVLAHIQKRDTTTAQPKRPVPASTARSIAPRASQTARAPGRSHGDPRARVTRTGVLALVAQRVSGADIPGAMIDGPGGFAHGIDQLIQGKQGFARAGSPGAGRAGLAGIGFEPGGGAPGSSVDDLMRDLMSPSQAIGLQPRLPSRREELRAAPSGAGWGTYSVSGRSRAEISRVVYTNLSALRHAYSMRLRTTPALGGRLSVKFLIDEHGRVFAASVVSSNTGDSAFDQLILAKIRAWRFDAIDKPGDVTEVVYPFVFSR